MPCIYLPRCFVASERRLRTNSVLANVLVALPPSPFHQASSRLGSGHGLATDSNDPCGESRKDPRDDLMSSAESAGSKRPEAVDQTIPEAWPVWNGVSRNRKSACSGDLVQGRKLAAISAPRVASSLARKSSCSSDTSAPKIATSTNNKPASTSVDSRNTRPDMARHVSEAAVCRRVLR